jgi:hypothetical protein
MNPNRTCWQRGGVAALGARTDRQAAERRASVIAALGISAPDNLLAITAEVIE